MDNSPQQRRARFSRAMQEGWKAFSETNQIGAAHVFRFLASRGWVMGPRARGQQHRRVEALCHNGRLQYGFFVAVVPKDLPVAEQTTEVVKRFWIRLVVKDGPMHLDMRPETPEEIRKRRLYKLRGLAAQRNARTERDARWKRQMEDRP